MIDSLDDKKYDAIILAVAHNEFLSIDFSKIKEYYDSLWCERGLDKKDIDKRL